MWHTVRSHSLTFTFIQCLQHPRLSARFFGYRGAVTVTTEDKWFRCPESLQSVMFKKVLRMSVS